MYILPCYGKHLVRNMLKVFRQFQIWNLMYWSMLVLSKVVPQDPSYLEIKNICNLTIIVFHIVSFTHNIINTGWVGFNIWPENTWQNTWFDDMRRQLTDNLRNIWKKKYKYARRRWFAWIFIFNNHRIIKVCKKRFRVILL